jgi:hypothetical protein
MRRNALRALLPGLSLGGMSVSTQAEEARQLHFVDTPYPPYSIGKLGKAATDTFGLKVDYDDSDEICLQKLMAGRIDLVLVDELVGTARVALHDAMKKTRAVCSKPVAVYPYREAPGGNDARWVENQVASHSNQ